MGTECHGPFIPYYQRPNHNYLFTLGPVWKLKTLGDKKIINLVKKRYWDLRKTYWNKIHLLNLLNNYEKEIYGSGAYIREKSRWPNGNYFSRAHGLRRIKRYLAKRIYYMDKYISNLN